MKLTRYLVLATLVLAAMWGLGSLATVHDRTLAQDQPECTVTLQPSESIQQAIDQAAEGDVVCLTGAAWEENLTISNSLTLQGIG